MTSPVARDVITVPATAVFLEPVLTVAPLRLPRVSADRTQEHAGLLKLAAGSHGAK